MGLSNVAENGSRFSLYGGRDPRDLPAYPLDLAARLLLLPRSTLKAWVFGAKWKQRRPSLERTFEPLINPPDRSQHMLSFVNLVEAHVLKAVRRKHFVHMAKVRDALERMKQDFNTDHPLADVDLLAGGKDLFIGYGQLLNLGMGKQVAMDFLRVYLSRIDRALGDEINGKLKPAAKLFPFIVRPIKVGKEIIEPDASISRIIAIDPYISFGRPAIYGTNIPSDAIAGRFFGGDSIDELMEDFGRSSREIECAIRYHTAQLETDQM